MSVGSPGEGDRPADRTAVEPFIAKVPPWQASLVFLLAAVAAAVAIYSGLGTGARIFAALVAAVAGVSGLLAARAYVYADGEGVSVRTFRPRFFPWADITSVEVVTRKNQPRVYLLRDERGSVALPSFVFLPLTPAGLGKTLNRINSVTSEITAQRPR